MKMQGSRQILTVYEMSDKGAADFEMERRSFQDADVSDASEDAR